MRKKHKDWYYKIRQKPQLNKHPLWVNCDSGYWKMKYLWEAALRNYQIYLFLLRGIDVARAEGTRSYLFSCNNFSFLHEAASEMNFRTFFFFFERKKVKEFDIVFKILQLPLQLISAGKELWGRYASFHIDGNISGESLVDCWWGETWLNWSFFLNVDGTISKNCWLAFKLFTSCLKLNNSLIALEIGDSQKQQRTPKLYHWWLGKDQGR